MSSSTPADPVAVELPFVDNKPDKPIMGNLASLSKDDWSAWTGGKPSFGWSGLDRSAAEDLLSPNQLRPVHASSSQKGYNYRRTGMTTQFTPASSLVDFQNAIWDHFTDCGMDSIAYLTDPEDAIAMTNVIKSHSRYTIQTARNLSALQMLRYDKYDKNNDRAAVKYLLSSLTPALMSKIKEKTEDTDSFHIVWLQLIKTIQSTSIERFEDLKVKIKARHPSQYSGENLESLAADFRKDARELVTAGQYDHNLTLTMLKTFLLAGGIGNEDFRFPLRATKQNLDKALLDIGYKEKTAAQAHMVASKLTYQEICSQAEDVYRTQYDRKEWPPAIHAPDVRIPSSTFGNVATPASASITRAEVLNLIQNGVSGSTTPDYARKGNCHKCGKLGHWANKCPDNLAVRHKTNEHPGSSTNRGGNGFRRTNKHQHWRTVPPPPGTGTAKKIKDKTFNWCDKCKRWTPTHTTATHTGERQSGPRANLSTLSHDPSVWLFDFPSTNLFFLPTLADLYFLLINTSALILLVVSIVICLVVPSTVSLAIHLSKAIPWSTIIDWISNSLHQIVDYNPCLAFAPILWSVLITFPLWFHPTIPIPDEPTKFTRQQRRQFDKVLKPYTTKSRKTSIITRNLHSSYPLRLRNKGHFIPSQAPTTNHRQSLAHLDELKHRAINLQRRAQRLRTPRFSSKLPSGTVQKGEILTKRREYTRQCKRAPKYCPIPAVASPNAFMPAQWTEPQMHAARLIATHVNLARATTLRMALQAPARMRNSLGPSAPTCPVIWDSGASISISPDPKDFNDTLKKPGTITQLKGIARDLHIKGQGEVTWALHDINGNLRTLKIPAFYVPGIKIRLLSTTSLLQTYTDETITIEAHRLTLSGIEGDPNRAPLSVLVNPQNNLPTSEAYNLIDSLQVANALNATLNEVHESNQNLNAAEKELLRWHYRLGHIGFRKVQFLIRTGVLSKTEATRKLHISVCKLSSYPKCAACIYGKQHQRTTPGKTASSVVKDRENALKSNNLLPGQRVSVDHFTCTTNGRLLDSAGKTKQDDMYKGGCLFVDHASGFIFVEHQVSLNSHSTLKVKEKFENTCRSYGVIPQEYLTDNGTAFTSKEFEQNLAKYQQVNRFAGSGAHHHNGIAERNIRTIMAIARTMMLHSGIHWPSVADPALWPLAVTHAVYLVNHVPDPGTGLAPADVFTKTKWEQRKLHDLHVWGCPVYVLDSRIHGGIKVPRWSPRSVRSINLGFSPKHATTVPLVLHPLTGYITPQYHVVFDDWFASIAASIDELPDFNSIEWAKMFGDSAYQYILDDDDQDRLIVEEQDAAALVEQQRQEQRIGNAFDDANPPLPLPVDPPATTSPRLQQTQTPNRLTTLMTPRLSPELPPITQTREQPSPLTTPFASPLPPASISSPTPLRSITPAAPSPVKLFPTPTKSPTPLPVERQETTVSESVKQGSANDIRNLPPRRSNRSRNAPARLGYDGRQGRGYIAEAPLYLDWLFEETSNHQLDSTVAYKASSNDPDTLTFDEAMNDKDNLVEWQKASNSEIVSLERNGTWREVPMSQAETRILPGTWVFRRKRTPDGAISKYKARYCVRGDLQETEVETFAPVVAWSTVRLFLVLSLTLEWKTCTIDFSSAFVQAPLSDPVWIHLPRGYRSEKGKTTCLQLLKSLYGLSVAPRLWYEHLSEALKEEGFKTCINDPCLLYKDTIIVVLYVDDLGIAYSSKTDLDKLFGNLEKKGLNFTKEGSFTDFLGIKFEKDASKGTMTLTQKGLILKIKEATGMTESNYNWTPASQVALGIDPDGPAMHETWSYRSIVGMLLYLSTNTRPDISFAVSQVARFCHNPKKSHAAAIKTIVRYLHRTCEMGMIVKPTGDLSVDCYVDADFAGLHGRDPDDSPSSAKSRTGYIITLGGCPILWKSHLQTEISLSTLEAEYSALSSSMRTLLPLRSMLIEIIEALKLPHNFESTVKCQVFEDNNGALLLATKQRITNRTKYFQVKWHFFWSHVRDGTIQIVKVDTQEQWADFLTKGLSRESFERVRKLVQGW